MIANRLSSRLRPQSWLRQRTRFPFVVLTLCQFPFQSSSAQQTAAEVIRGRVTDDSARAIIASVIVTRGPDRLTLQATTDSAGNFRVGFEEGTGDYLVFVSAPGYVSARRRVQRQNTEHELIADFTLARGAIQLATVRVTGEKAERADNSVSPTELEPGASEKWRDGVNGQVPPSVSGDLNALTGTMPNITVTPDGPAVLGAGAGSNLTTLNGMGLGVGSIPRAARTETRVTAATFDPTRGGFAGANIDVRLGAGNRFFQRRNAFLTLDPRYFQFGDPTVRALSAVGGGFRASAGADGELIRSALTYNVALDLAHTTSDPFTLINASDGALLLAGVDRDSVTRLTTSATSLGLPLTDAQVPANRQQDALTWLGRLDDTRDTLATRTLLSYAAVTRDRGLGFGPLVAPSASGGRLERTIGGQLVLGNFVGPGGRVLTETRIAVSGGRTQITPYRELPQATILVRSPALDSNDQITALMLGGGSYLSTKDSRWTAEAGNETDWNADGHRHRFRSLVWARADALRQEGIMNGSGSFSFNSIQDFAASRPSSFSRTLSQPHRSGAVWNAAAALGHQYTPSPFFGLLYGARLEVDRFVTAPRRNPALEQAVGVRTGIAPSRVHLSPRFGFTYRYNRDKDNRSGIAISRVGRYYRNPFGVIRGGIGEFRDLLKPGIAAEASASSGLSGGTSSLNCVGAAVPLPDWSALASDAGAVPTQCLDGSGPLAESAPTATLIDPSYDMPRSWRASLDWSTDLKKWLIHISGLASYDLAQPGLTDANFAGVPRITLTDEANRPVFVSAAAIDSASGAVSATESRKSSQFGTVGMRVSDLRGYGGQLTFAVSPDMFRFKTGASVYISAAYTLQRTRRQYRGFDGAAFGDPRIKEWAAGQNDARHIFVLSGGFSAAKIGTVTFFARGQSGLPFTPLVQGDINGDGRTGDRAFVPNPTATPDSALGRELRLLLSTGSPSAIDCVVASVGHPPARNSCRGPWTQSLNIQWRPPTPKSWGNRVAPNIYLQNVLAGLDQLFHSSSSLRGWGSPATPDPNLLVPRAFNPTTGRFRYDVNPRFADTRPGRTLIQNPFRIVVDVSFDLSTNFDLQQLRRAIEPIRGANGWQRRSPDSLTAFYLSRTSSIHKLLLQESDSLFLSASQIQALEQADSVFSERVRALYMPLGEFLAQRLGGAGKAELDSVQTTQKAYWKIFWEQPEIAASIVNPSQRELIPLFKTILGTPSRDREHSTWQFGHPVTFHDKPRASMP
jgi:hypothetical protein